MLAAALRDVGLDVVDLGNIHLYDALGFGVTSTLSALDAVGWPHYGAGPDLDSAWAPALLERQGSPFAFVRYTTIRGKQTPRLYTAGPDRGGASPYGDRRLRETVAAEAAAARPSSCQCAGGSRTTAPSSKNVQGLSCPARGAGPCSWSTITRT